MPIHPPIGHTMTIALFNPHPLYNMVCYNTGSDITQVIAEPQMVIKDIFSHIHVTIKFTLDIPGIG